jgi:hypothetical protein
MSRLIFEGNTTKRFGEKFPKPFIEQVRAYDSGLQVDIAFYFKVPKEQQKVDSFVADLKNGSLSQSIVLSVINQTTLDRVKLGRNFDTLVKNEIDDRASEAHSTDTEEIMTKIISFADFVSGQETPPQESESYSSYNIAIKDDFYSLDGTRYMKIFATLVVDYNSSDELYIACFLKNGLGTKIYQNQTSDLIFEKVLNKDRTLTRDPIVAFKEQNNTFYYQQPLMSLSKRYHKTDNYGHTEMIKQFSDVLSGYSIDESNDLLTLLDTESTNPRLLILIKNKIENFTDKSPATPVGRLYSQLASNIVLADSLINRQEVVLKRQITNHKIKDFRNTLLPNLEKMEEFGYFYAIDSNSERFISKPLASISVYPFSPHENTELILNTDSLPSNLLFHFVTQLNSYYFVDYEKLLNYKSEISKIFNPYNIIQIFGKGALANYFQYKTVSVLRPNATQFEYSQGRIQNTYARNMILNYSNGKPSDFTVLYHPTEGQPTSVAGVEGAFIESRFPAFESDKIVFGESSNNNNDSYKYAQLVQRYSNTIRDLGDYRISCFELTDFEKPHATDHFFKDEFTFNIKIEDKTMLFYENFIKSKIISLKEELKKYLDFAEDFCSFNNVDNKFNDFFIDNIRQQFVEPYPWTEAPLYYYLFSQLINVSISTTAADNRLRNGLLIDLESVKVSSLTMAKNISPESGDLNTLQTFYNLLENLVNNYFIKGAYLDTKFNIYKNITNDYAGEQLLQNPIKTFSMERKDHYGELTPIDYIDVFGSIEEYEQAEAARAEAAAQDEEMTRKCYNYQVDWVNRQIDLFRRVSFIGSKSRKKKREDEAGELNDVKGWLNTQEEKKDNYRSNNCSEYSPGGVDNLANENIGLDWLYDLGYAANVSPDRNWNLGEVRNIIEDGL